MARTEPQDIGPFATEIFEDTHKELVSRLEQGLETLSEADRMAILTAIAKASWNGILRGIAITAYAVNTYADAQEERDPDADALRLDVDMKAKPAPDMWADRFAEEG